MAGRVFERKRRQMPCTLTLDGRHHGGLILDLSPGGLFIQSRTKLKPGDQIEVQMTIPAVEGRVKIQALVVRKVVVPTRLLKVARGGVGVQIINAPEAYYQFMESLGITGDSDPSKPAQAGSPSAGSAAMPPVAEVEPEPEASDKSPTAQPRFRVRVKQTQGPRSRAVEVAAQSEDDARRQALAEVGDDWIVLGVERVGAD